jgi:hypothetical protein
MLLCRSVDVRRTIDDGSVRYCSNLGPVQFFSPICEWFRRHILLLRGPRRRSVWENSEIPTISKFHGILIRMIGTIIGY